MYNILITEAGAAPAENVIKSFMECPEKRENYWYRKRTFESYPIQCIQKVQDTSCIRA